MSETKKSSVRSREKPLVRSRPSHTLPRDVRRKMKGGRVWALLGIHYSQCTLPLETPGKPNIYKRVRRKIVFQWIPLYVDFGKEEGNPFTKSFTRLFRRRPSFSFPSTRSPTPVSPLWPPRPPGLNPPPTVGRFLRIFDDTSGDPYPIPLRDSPLVPG